MEYFNNLDWQIFGWLMAICFSLQGIPQAWRSYKQKHSHGVSWGLLILWLLGEIFGILYILPKMDIPLLSNYLINTFFVSVIIYYKLKGKRNE